MKGSRSNGLLRGSFGLWMLLITSAAIAQNSMVGDGFGGRLWYRPTNYGVGSYSAYSLCYTDLCDSSSNQLLGWGADYYNQLGNGPGWSHSDVPVLIPGMSNVRYFSSGYWTGAIKNDGTGWVWIEPDFGFPTQVISDVAFLDAGAYFLSFVKMNGTVWSMGMNDSGQLGDGTQIDQFIQPVQMNNVTNAVRTACAYSTSFVLLADSTVLAVGENVNGLLGDPTITDPLALEVTPVSTLSGIVDIKAHSAAVAALDQNGDVYCWGRGGHTGDGDMFNDTLPKRVQGLDNIVAISGCSDGIHFLALDAYGNCYSWGEFNQLGSWNLAPILVATDVIDIMAGESFSYIVKSNGALWASGRSIVDGASIWLDVPDVDGNGDPIFRSEFVQLTPALIPSACPVWATAAVPSADCDGSIMITVTHTGGQPPYQYDIGNGPQASNVFTDVLLGDYTVTITDASGCVITIPCTVDAAEADPILLDMGTVSACVDEGFTLPSGTTVFTSGIYSDTTFSTFGCDTVRLFTLEMEELQSNVAWQYTLCADEPFTMPNGDIVYAPGVFTDTIELVGECDTLYIAMLILSTLPPIAAGVSAQQTQVFVGDSVALFPSGGLDLEWSPSSTLSCTTCPNPFASPTETTEYCVVVTGGADSGIGCGSDIACITITVIEPPPIPCAAENIFVPTAFSPDASGTNDQQCVQGAQCISSMNFAIYDRWGLKVFETTDPEACWDGTFDGQALDPAVFVYHLIATLNNEGTVERQGNITLVR